MFVCIYVYVCKYVIRAICCLKDDKGREEEEQNVRVLKGFFVKCFFFLTNVKTNLYFGLERMRFIY